MQPGNPTHHPILNAALWRRIPVQIAAALSVALLTLGLLLPDRLAAPLVGLGLAGILAIRLTAMGSVRSPHGASGAIDGGVAPAPA